MGYWGVKHLGYGIWAPLCHPPTMCLFVWVFICYYSNTLSKVFDASQTHLVCLIYGFFNDIVCTPDFALQWRFQGECFS